MKTNNVTRKGKRFFAPTIFTAFLALAFLTILGCSEPSDGDMPCLLCDSEDYRKCGSEWYNAAKSDLRCRSNVVETKCGTEDWYDDKNTDLNCRNNALETRCGTGSSFYNPSTQFCIGNSVHDKCGNSTYSPETQFCQSGTNAVLSLCGTRTYSSTEFCQSGTNAVLSLCGSKTYTVTEFCQSGTNAVLSLCGTRTYSSTEFCQSGTNAVLSLCSGNTYTATERCQSGVIETKCGTGSSYYNPATEFCIGNSVHDKCGGSTYDPSNQRCQNNVIETECGTGNSYYNPSTQFCTGNSVHDKCGGSTYSPATEFCQSGTDAVKSLCGTQTYSATEFCQSPNVVKSLCGTQTYTSNQRCESNIVEAECGTSWYNLAAMEYCSNGTIEIYKTVVIGTQTWMAENLNYDVVGSKCYNNQESNCDTYGRLYDWSTAMALPSSCNSTSCSGQVNAKHKGICPPGWHIPSNADWDELMTAVGGSSTAGTYLKATSGWYNCGSSGSGNSYLCEDTHGFSALPGGYGYSDGSFSSVGNRGYWWSASENYSDRAYYRYMDYNYEYAYYSGNNKNNLFSVRCVQD
jgi:uncharacterized protein (TIGR02145 family)